MPLSFTYTTCDLVLELFAFVAFVRSHRHPTWHYVLQISRWVLETQVLAYLMSASFLPQLDCRTLYLLTFYSDFYIVFLTRKEEQEIFVFSSGLTLMWVPVTKIGDICMLVTRNRKGTTLNFFSVYQISFCCAGQPTAFDTISNEWALYQRKAWRPMSQNCSW